ncbi:hypothetical protein C7T35_15540 [Variovorax sp. WS11]|uniref:hypothetical protein n=1 Tax=Variovorax sp. WS11 TaxID=1105204 RepID=UPI000D0CAFE5|nr:hypothetical protein [Variovorax sp. WS11]NDZ12023.1 hypothetical protein [Variovorax sp. WS11]PSL83791.1 hypothetical protein C7T35_15540 [Variovorax sp. WS11]
MRRLILLAIVAAASGAQAAGWDYQSDTDKMSGKKNTEAQVQSDNRLNFGFPYNGSNGGHLVVRQHPQYGLDVTVGIDQGQMLCNTMECRVTVKFDDAAPVAFGGSPPADHSSTAIFLSNASRFIASAKKAKKILIQFTAYQNGNPVLEFSTPQPLDWPRK